MPTLPTLILPITTSSPQPDLLRLSAGKCHHPEILGNIKLINISDPWWIFTAINLFWNIKYRYEFKPLEIIRISPRFGLLLLSMSLSIIFITVDLLSVTPVIPIGYINPFWKFAFIFKCFTDTIILDDFKTALDKLSRHKMNQNYPLPFSRPSSSQMQNQNNQMARRSVGNFEDICRLESLNVTVEHLERTDDSIIRAPARVVRTSDAGLLGRTY
jgi:hypothetical protein